MPRAPNLAPQEALLLVGPRLWHRFNTARIPLDYMGETVFIPPLLLGDRPGPPAAGHTTWPLWRHGARRQQEHGTHCWGSAAKERGKERETQRVHQTRTGLLRLGPRRDYLPWKAARTPGPSPSALVRSASSPRFGGASHPKTPNRSQGRGCAGLIFTQARLFC